MNIQESNPKLSTIAAFDDICRQLSCLLDSSVEDVLIELLKRVNEWRLDWCYCENEVKEWKEKYNKLEIDFIALERTIKNLRECYKREADLKEKMIKEKDQLLAKLNQVKSLLNDRKIDDFKERQKVVSCLELNLAAIKEKNDSIDNCLSESDFDVTDEDILQDLSPAFRLKRTSNDDQKFPPPKRSCDKLEKVAIEIDENINQEKKMEIDQNFQILNKVSEFKKSESKFNIISPININQKKVSNRGHNFVQKKSFESLF